MGCGSSQPQIFAAIEAGDSVKVRDILLKKPQAASSKITLGGDTALHFAAYREPGDKGRCIEALLSTPGQEMNGFNANKFTPLMLAAAHGKASQAQALLTSGAKADVGSPATGDTALHLAAGHGHPDCLQVAINCGANLNVTNNDLDTPLHSACEYDKIECVLVLLGSANFAAQNKSGKTPLHTAAEAGSIPICQALLKAGADRAAKDAQGLTPGRLAIASGKHECAAAIGETLKEGDIPQDADGATYIAKEGLFPVGEATRKRIQDLVDVTWKDLTTRDRDFSKVHRFEVVQALENVQHAKRERYNDAREKVALHYVKRLGDIKTVTETWEESLQEARKVEANEFFLFHGTKPEAALSICASDFRTDLSGSNKGSLYGPGIYLAESSSKADEYAMDDIDGLYKGLYAMLLCRTTLGNPFVTTENTPSISDLDHQMRADDHHSILGDREALKGTFREFIVREVAQVFPAYVIIYRRI